jgi:hypothetical protein
MIATDVFLVLLGVAIGVAASLATGLAVRVALRGLPLAAAPVGAAQTTDAPGDTDYEQDIAIALAAVSGFAKSR